MTGTTHADQPLSQGAPGRSEERQSPRNHDPRTIERNPTATGLVIVIGLIVCLAIPVATASMLGADSYERLFRTYPGPATAMITTVLLVGAELSGLVTVGALVHCLFLREADPKSTWIVDRTIEFPVLQFASGAWATFAGGLAIVTAFDVNGQPLSRLVEPAALPQLWEATQASQAWTVTFVAAVLVFCAGVYGWRWTGLLLPLWASVFGVLAPVLTGQVLVGPAHDLGSDAAIFQTLAAVLLFGAVLVAWIRVLSGRFLAVETLRRLATLAAVALPVIIATDLVITWFKLAGSSLSGSLTGRFIVLRWILLAVIVITGVSFAHLGRRGRLRDRSILWLLTVLALTILVWAGLGAAMTREPPPQYFVPTSIQQNFLGFDVPLAPDLTVLFTQWRLNLLFAGIAVAAVAIYLLAVRALHRRGDSWPVGRTVAWILGWVVVVFVTSSGFGKYSAPDFGVHMIVHMSLNMLAPAILSLGGVITLLLRSTSGKRSFAGIHDWLNWIMQWPLLRILYNPLLVFLIFVGSYYGLYLTGLFETLMPYHWGHQLMNLHFLIIGYLFYSLVIGVDRPPRPLPHIGKLGYVLAAMPFHAFFGVIVMQGAGGENLIAGDFYRRLDLPWTNLIAAQELGGGVAWAGGEIPLIVVVIILGVQWSRQDAREARRKDRHMDSGRDTDFDDYNAMLAQLSRRQERPGVASASADSGHGKDDGTNAH